MKTPRSTKNAEQGAAGQGAAIVARTGALPTQHDTVTAEVLARLLGGERLTGLDAVYEASTTRLSAVAHHLAKTHGWTIDTTDKATGCNDGRVAWVVEYHLHPEAIAQAMQEGAGAWCNEVRKARLERRKKVAQAERAAAQANAAHRTRHFHINQSSLFEGPAA